MIRVIVFLYNHLESCLAFICGLLTLTIDVEHVIAKLAMSILLGAGGYVGGLLIKKLEQLISKIMKKRKKKC